MPDVLYYGSQPLYSFMPTDISRRPKGVYVPQTHNDNKNVDEQKIVSSAMKERFWDLQLYFIPDQSIKGA